MTWDGLRQEIVACAEVEDQGSYAAGREMASDGCRDYGQDRAETEQGAAGSLSEVSQYPENALEALARSPYACDSCRDSGFVELTRAGNRYMRQCDCTRRAAAERRLRNAGIPAKFADACFARFKADPAAQNAASAKLVCERMVEEFLMRRGGQGVLLTGTCGVGKTHLATAALKAAMTAYGVPGKFWDMSNLLTQVKRTFQRSGEDAAPETESALVREFADVDVLVVDELGGERLSEWAWSELNLLLNARYNGLGNKPKITIITTNLQNLGAGEGRSGVETLGDRIGSRMFSRLQEMCRPLDMSGRDFRMRRAV